MRGPTRTLAVAIAAAAIIPSGSIVAQQSSPTIDQFLSPGYPSELVSAAKADRIAWIGWERGKRNIFSAAAPTFAPTRLTKFLNDDGIELSELELSADGTIALFVRGSEPNRAGWIANPTGNPDGAERAIWAAKTDGGSAWRIARGTSPALSPDGKWVAFSATDSRSGQPEVYVAPFPAPTKRFRISADGGSQARWRKDGKEILYLAPSRMLMSAQIAIDSSGVTVKDYEPLFELQHPYGAYHAFDLAPDGKRFLVNTLVVSPERSRVIAALR